MRSYTLLLPVILLLSCGKKDDQNKPTANTCPLESLGNEGIYTVGTLSTLRYDQQDRVIRVDYQPGGGYTDIQYPANGVVTYRTQGQGGGPALHGIVRYDAAGDYVYHSRVWTNADGDSLDRIEDHFSYDADRQRKSYIQIASARPGSLPAGDTVERFDYTWANGNMVSAATKRYGNITYDYYPGTDGSFFDNTPAEMTLHYNTVHMYPFAAAFGQPKHSKWLLKSISGVLGGWRFEYDTNAKGRVVTKRAYLNGTGIPNETYQETYRYKWRCD